MINLTNDEMSPVAVFKKLNSANKEWVTWVPETIWSLGKFSAVNKHKAMAIQTILKGVELSLDMFENVVTAFNGSVPDVSILEVVSVGEIGFTIACLDKMKIKPILSEDAVTYIQTVMKHDGFTFMPWLEIGTPPSDWAKADALPVKKAINQKFSMATEKLLEAKLYIEVALNE